MAGLGLRLALPIAAGVLGGVWLDSLLGTTPWLLLVATLVGLGVAFYELIDLARSSGSRS
jgi:ATP synthase protein I